MNLQTFISQALTEIFNGVDDALKKVPGICPPTARVASRPEGFHVRKDAALGSKAVSFQFVEFDVAVTAGKTEGGKAGIGVVSLGLGAGVDTKSTNEQVSRVRFKLPLVLPADIAGE